MLVYKRPKPSRYNLSAMIITNCLNPNYSQMPHNDGMQRCSILNFFLIVHYPLITLSYVSCLNKIRSFDSRKLHRKGAIKLIDVVIYYSFSKRLSYYLSYMCHITNSKDEIPYATRYI